MTPAISRALAAQPGLVRRGVTLQNRADVIADAVNAHLAEEAEAVARFTADMCALQTFCDECGTSLKRSGDDQRPAKVCPLCGAAAA